ncbi:MAG: BatA domain-containing protein [Pirellulales bacterium]
MEAAEWNASATLFGAWFLHPWLVGAGAAAMLVPWAIHWFSRRRVRTVQWAAMRLLVGAQQRDATRVKIEDRTLLALRMLWLLLAGLLVGRPYWHAGPDAASAPTEFIVLLDDSLSMHAIGPDGSAFARAKRRLIEWIEARSESGRDLLTVRLASAPESAVLDRTPLTAARRAAAIHVIERLEASDVRVEWPRTLVAVKRVEQRESTRRRALFVVSDFRRSDWLANSNPAWELVQTNSEGFTWAACDVGMPIADNVSLESLEADGIAADGVPVTYRARVKNWGKRVVAAAAVELRVGETAPRTATLGALPPGESAVCEFPVVLQAGLNSAAANGVVLEARLVREGAGQRDELPNDDVVLAAAPGGAGVGVFFVTDSEQSRPSSRSTSTMETRWDLLARALTPDLERPSGFHVLAGSIDDWETWKTARVMAASGEETWSELSLKRLNEWLSEGGTLVLSPSLKADATAWNARWAANDRRLSPVRLVQVGGDEERRRWSELGDWDEGWAAARLMRELTAVEASRVKVYRWWESQIIDPPNGIRMWGRLADASRTPLLVERQWGRGRCWWTAVPLDESASDWPLDPSYVIFWQEALRAAVQQDERFWEAKAGAPLVWEAPIGEVRRQASVATASLEKWSVTGETAIDSPGRWRFESPPTKRSGVYTWTLTEVDGSARTRLAVVNRAEGESDLHPLGEEERSQTVLRDWRRLAGDQPWADQWTTTGDGWTWLVWFAMIMLGIEQALAWKISRRRG